MFDVAQLRSHGLGERRITRMVRDGRLIRRHRGVYRDPLVRATARGELLAARLAVGEASFLSRRTSLAVLGVRPLNLRAIEVTVAAEHTPRRPGLIVHRTTVTPLAHELRIVDGLVVACAALALAEAAGAESPVELDRLLRELARRRLLDLTALVAVRARRPGLPGAIRLTRALERHRPPAHADVSTFERDVAAFIAADPDIPPPQRNVRIGPWELDVAWIDLRVCLEVDGDPGHFTVAGQERDRIKDAWLAGRGWRVLRITGFRFAHDRAGIRADLLAILHAAARSTP